MIASLDSTLVAATDRRLGDFSALFATAIANMHAREQVADLAEQQAALRRVATLAARESAPVEVLAAVAVETARALGTEAVGMLRFEQDGSATLVAQSKTPWDPPPLGTRLTLDGENIVASVHRTGRASRMDDWANATGSVAAMANVLGITSAVATPVVVEGRLWGTMVAATSQSDPLAPDTESRIEEFTELVATAIANAESRAALGELADEQAALRRVATLVGHGVPPSEIFSAVSEEVARLFDSGAGVLKFEHGSVVFVGVANVEIPLGTRWEFQEEMTSAEVYKTGGSARAEEVDLSSVDGPVGEASRRLGTVSTVSSPIVVESRLWGAMTVSSRSDLLPLDTEERLEKFTELVATAIANAATRAELAASRARIVATADATRRRIERDLHDGAQQQLVSLALELRAAQAALPPELNEQRAELSSVVKGLTVVLDELREISSGIHPAILSEGGLAPALKTLARRSPIPVMLDVRVDGRLPESLEVAAYYVVSEMLTNAAKHAHASSVQVDVTGADGVLGVAVRDDGIGGADPARGSGLVGLRDRVETLGGTITVDSPRGRGTSIDVALPLD